MCGMLIGEIIQVNSTTELTKTHVEWIIKNYHKFNAYFRSPSFTFADMSWHIVLDNDAQLRVKFINDAESKTVRDYDVIFSFGIKKVDGSIETRILPQHSTPLVDKYDYHPYFLDYLIHDERLGYMKDHTLTITCDLESILPREGKCFKNMSIEGLESLSKDLKDHFENKVDCDVLLIVQGKQFKAHSFILTARSSVFAAMFRQDSSERKTGKVTISDCDPNYFLLFLEFLYCGKFEAISSDNVVPIYWIAKKYLVENLKAFCVNYLMQIITVKNVCDIFAFANDNDETNLIKSTEKYFKKHFEKISKTSEWNNLLENNYPLAKKLLTKK